jgi:hypothetical protein
MNHRPLIVIFLGMLCLYAALIPLGGLASQTTRLPDFFLYSPWLLTEQEIDLTVQASPGFRQLGIGDQTSGVLLPASYNTDSTKDYPADVELQRYPPLPNARPPVWSPIGG